MSDRESALMSVEAEARKLLGDGAAEWMVRPSKVLDGMMPAELATSPEGATVVLHELRRVVPSLRAVRQSEQARRLATKRQIKTEVI
ncbi:MAG TPA: antitoxin Xre/MbcA/ParS toxin-binding domain-containing protein [Stellaceae bacterium]|nr:antitoxin Xre/MbcA/ParS toxin-binding domain-containing protein [Stellaceae bacterium]